MSAGRRLQPGVLAVLAASWVAAVGAQPGDMPRYEPSQRLRTGIETCRKDEVMNAAYCVKRCQEGFRLDVSKRPPVCVGLRADARPVPAAPAYKPTPAAPAPTPPAPATGGSG